MKRKEVSQIIKAKYKEYTYKVIDEIKALGPECCQSGDDSPLENVWEEFKYQMQEEESFFFDAYEDTIRSVCRGMIKSLPESELRLLWLTTDDYIYYDEKGFPHFDELVEAVEDELYSVICGIASDEELEYLVEQEDYEDNE